MRNGRNLLVSASLILAGVLILAGCGGAATPAPTPVPPAPTSVPPTAMVMPTTESGNMGGMDTMKPSNGNATPGPAITQNLQGDPASGAKIFDENCKKCHGEEGKGGVTNPGASEETMPALNPVDEDMGKDDPQVFALTLDLFIEHGSTPEGPDPKNKMPAWGDDGKLTPQQIADVIAYIVSLNK